MPPKKKETASSFGVSVIFILSIVVLVLMFVLFSRDQGTKNVEETLKNLAITNAELQKEKKSAQQKTLQDKLKDAGLDPMNVWTLSPCEQTPYCEFSLVTADPSATTNVRAIERWKGYYDTYKDEQTTCETFVFEEGSNQRAINMDWLTSVEQNLIKASDATEPTELTVFRHDDQPVDQMCDQPVDVLNVHFE